jgi:hypothetical protein
LYRPQAAKVSAQPQISPGELARGSQSQAGPR